MSGMSGGTCCALGDGDFQKCRVTKHISNEMKKNKWHNILARVLQCNPFKPWNPSKNAFAFMRNAIRLSACRKRGGGDEASAVQ